jgi:aspartate/methionine/tyrosine aminotransferase
MRHPSAYLDWYLRTQNVKYDLRSSGITYFKHNLALGEVDLNVNHLNQVTELLAGRYHVKPENLFILSEGASGQNARIIRYLAERNGKKSEAIVEYPTYEPLLRQVQEHFPRVKRLEREENDSHRLDAAALRKIVSDKTALLVITNPHAPSGHISDRSELEEIMAVAGEYGFYVLCDEIYAEFERSTVPTLFSVDNEFGIATTSFTKAYGLGGLRLGIAVAQPSLVTELYTDVINTIGGGSNLVMVTSAELLTKGMKDLERHKQKWMRLKAETEEWLGSEGYTYFPSKAGVTYWVKMPIENTHKWMSEHTVPRYGLALVPGAFFLFKNNYKIVETGMVRLGLGAMEPDGSSLTEALDVLKKAIVTYKAE